VLEGPFWTIYFLSFNRYNNNPKTPRWTFWTKVSKVWNSWNNDLTYFLDCSNSVNPDVAIIWKKLHVCPSSRPLQKKMTVVSNPTQDHGSFLLQGAREKVVWDAKSGSMLYQLHWWNPMDLWGYNYLRTGEVCNSGPLVTTSRERKFRPCRLTLTVTRLKLTQGEHKIAHLEMLITRLTMTFYSGSWGEFDWNHLPCHE
jgi:hypothetical protein